MIVAKTLRGVAAALAVAVLFCQSAVASIGLGEARVQSFLGQNLDVRIALVESGETTLEGMEVSVASAEDYARLGVPSEALALGLSAALDLAADPPVVRLRSTRPVTDPFVQVLLNARWASGRLLREYTLFLDPPAVPVAPPVRRVEAQPSAPTIQNIDPPAPAEAESAAEPEPEPEPVSQQSAASSARPRSDVPPTSLVVERGQTLWSIAAEWRPDRNLTMNQAMLAILDRNPEAFIGENVNRLRRGARLILPDVEQARVISASEATRRIREQTQAWEAGRNTPAVDPIEPIEPVEQRPEPVEPDPPAVDSETEGREPEATASEMAEDPAQPNPDADQTQGLEEEFPVEPASLPRLELAPPDEELVAEAAAIDTERQRLSGQLAELESDMVRDGLQSPETDALVDQISQAIDSGDAGGLLVASEDLARLEQQLRETREAREAEQSAAQVAEQPAPPPTAAAPEPPAAAPASFLQRWMWPLVGVAAGLVLLTLLIGLLRSRAARRAEDRMTEPGQDREPRVETPEDLTSERTAGEATQAEEDPDAQAAALMGILSRDDEEDEEESYQTGMAAETEEQPEARAGSDRDDGSPDLARLSDRLDPEDLDDSRFAQPTPEALRLEDEEIETLFSSSESMGGRTEEPDESDAEPLTLEFDVPEPGLDEDDLSISDDRVEAAQSSYDAESDPVEPDESRISDADPDVDGSDDAGATVASPPVETEEPDWFALEGTEDADDEAMEEDSGASDEVPALGDEDAEVKLDLARAYISMEDPDSARTLLDEVLSDGSPSHREQAQKLLDSLR